MWTPYGFIIAIIVVALLSFAAIVDSIGLGYLATPLIVLGLFVFVYGLYRTARNINNTSQIDYQELANRLNDCLVSEEDKRSIRLLLKQNGIKYDN